MGSSVITAVGKRHDTATHPSRGDWAQNGPGIISIKPISNPLRDFARPISTPKV
jgi:hypothetical protein